MVNKNKKLENQLKILEKSLNEDGYLSQYNSIKNELDVYLLEANAIGMNTKFSFFEFRKTTRSPKHNKNLLLMVRKLQTKHIF